MSDQEKRIQEAITLFQAGRKYSKHGTIKINLNEDGYDVVLSALNEKLQRERQEPELKRAFAAFNWERDNELGDVYICQECGQRMYGNGHKYCSGCGLPLYYDEDYAPEPKQEPDPPKCEVIKFARVGEKSDKLFSAHIFPEEQILTVEVRSYNGAARQVAGDVIQRSEYENYDPFLTFEFYQKESVIALRDTCNWIIDTLEGENVATEPKGEHHD